LTVSADPAAAAAPALTVTVEWPDGRPDARPVRTLPTATVVIPVHDRMDLTATCLARLAEVSPGDPLVEIVVVDDASAADTTAALREWCAKEPRLRVIRQESNRGFLASSNRGAAEARGEVLVFLNNDTAPEPGWLEALLATLARDVTVGAVGGKLLYPDGTLQEAGSVVFNDGSACNFGRGDFEPDAPLYSFVREVDYCSGALLATRADVFRAIGGFDARFAPAYYEDTDYCLSLWARGLRVLYQPAARVVHLEGGSHGTNEASGMKRFQTVNQGKLFEKWAAVLATHPPRPDRFDASALHALAFRTWGERPK
jgi:GT2 family glycosyltransferase